MYDVVAEGEESESGVEGGGVVGDVEVLSHSQCHCHITLSAQDLTLLATC
jgi:hypothetical protein